MGRDARGTARKGSPVASTVLATDLDKMILQSLTLSKSQSSSCRLQQFSTH